MTGRRGLHSVGWNHRDCARIAVARGGRRLASAIVSLLLVKASRLRTPDRLKAVRGPTEGFVIDPPTMVARRSVFVRLYASYVSLTAQREEARSRRCAVNEVRRAQARNPQETRRQVVVVDFLGHQCPPLSQGLPPKYIKLQNGAKQRARRHHGVVDP